MLICTFIQGLLSLPVISDLHCRSNSNSWYEIRKLKMKLTCQLLTYYPSRHHSCLPSSSNATCTAPPIHLPIQTRANARKGMIYCTLSIHQSLDLSCRQAIISRSRGILMKELWLMAILKTWSERMDGVEPQWTWAVSMMLLCGWWTAQIRSVTFNSTRTTDDWNQSHPLSATLTPTH